tara:strand:- start:106 stop:432 length:327 start_codon:yes stop_codon:yes gene_type:complete
MTKKDTTTEVVIIEKGFLMSRGHLAFIYFLISWPIIYLLCFVTRQEWFIGYSGYLTSLTTGSGTPNTAPNASFNNTVLSDQGRENILWVSFLFSLLVGLLAYFILYYI